jgi:hypothetical protein
LFPNFGDVQTANVVTRMFWRWEIHPNSL